MLSTRLCQPRLERELCPALPSASISLFHSAPNNGSGVKLCLLRFPEGSAKPSATEGGGLHALPLPFSQTPPRGRLPDLQSRLPGHCLTANPVPRFSIAAAEDREGGGQLAFSLGAHGT